MAGTMREGIWFVQSLFSLVRSPHPYTLKKLPYWVWSLTPFSSPIKDQVPYITFPAREFLEPKLSQKMRIFEFGPGGSTFFFAPKVKEIVCVEHDETWHGIMQTYLKNRQVKNCILMLCRPTKLKQVVPYSPSSNTSKEYRHTNLCFKKYTTSICAYPDGYFDIVLVDGRARPSCIKQSVSKVKSKGFLILDNSDREDYACAFPLLKGFKRMDFAGLGPRSAKSWCTTFWQKR